MTEDKVRENRLRRMAERRGYTISRSRRDTGVYDYGGYMVCDTHTNAVVLGAHRFAVLRNSRRGGELF